MIDPIAVGQTKEFTAKDDKVNPTIWIFGALDSVEQAEILRSGLSISVNEEGVPVVDKQKEATNDFVIVSYGLKGWKNFGDIEFKTEKKKLFDRECDVVPMELLKLIPVEIIFELADQIWGKNHVDEKLEKN